MVAVLLLRRMAYTLLALFRSVTLRSEESRGMRWKDLLAWVRDALIAAAAEPPRQRRGRRRLTLTCRAPTGGADIAGT